MAQQIKYVLVTGATGFIGAHVVDELLRRGFQVRCATRSPKKGQTLLDARPKYSSLLDVVLVRDFEEGGDFSEAVKGVDAVVHVASPLNYSAKDNEKQLILPAINGVRSILSAAKNSNVRRVVVTSSFAAIIDVERRSPAYFTYTAANWNSLTYAEATDKSTNSVLAYRASKKFAELAAWDFVKEQKPSFDLVTICPPMTFGPIVHPLDNLDQLNESNSQLWKVASGAKLPIARVPFWVDVRDLAAAHVEALVRRDAGNKRFVVGSQERYSYSLASKAILEHFPWAKGKVSEELQSMDESYGLDGKTAEKELGISYRTFKASVVDLISQLTEIGHERA